MLNNGSRVPRFSSMKKCGTVNYSYFPFTRNLHLKIIRSQSNLKLLLYLTHCWHTSLCMCLEDILLSTETFSFCLSFCVQFISMMRFSCFSAHTPSHKSKNAGPG